MTSLPRWNKRINLLFSTEDKIFPDKGCVICVLFPEQGLQLTIFALKQIIHFFLKWMSLFVTAGGDTI